MPIVNNPSAGAFVSIQEAGTSGTGSAGTPRDDVAVGAGTGTSLSTSGGAGTSCTKKISALLSLAVSTPQTIDLNNFAAALGAVAFTKVHGYLFRHQGAADSSGTITITPGSSNGWSNGPFSSSGQKLAPGSTLYQENFNTAGWAVSGTNKTLQFDPGSNAQSLVIVVFGE